MIIKIILALIGGWVIGIITTLLSIWLCFNFIEDVYKIKPNLK